MTDNYKEGLAFLRARTSFIKYPPDINQLIAGIGALAGQVEALQKQVADLQGRTVSPEMLRKLEHIDLLSRIQNPEPGLADYGWPSEQKDEPDRGG